MAEIYANNAAGTLESDIGSSDTSISVESGHTFPSPGGDDWFRATLYRYEWSGDGRQEHDHEVVKVTDVSGDTLTVERGLEGDAVEHSAGDPVELRPTAGLLDGIRDYADDNLSSHADSDGGVHGVPSDESVLHTGDRGTGNTALPRNSEVLTDEDGDAAGYRLRLIDGDLVAEEIT